MPGGDRTGPRGMGPLTGRRMGLCAGYPYPGFLSPGFGAGMGYGRGFGRGMGVGRGRGWWGAGYSGYQPYFPHPYSEENEMSLLENQAREIRDILNQIEKRLDELKKSTPRSTKK
jgi:hypothetical protein